MIKNKNQNGIALIETLLIILILVIIGFGGYYVWHTQKQTDKTLNTALKTSSSAASSQPKLLSAGVDGILSFKYPANWTLKQVNEPTYRSMNPDDPTYKGETTQNTTITSPDGQTSVNIKGGIGGVGGACPPDQVGTITDLQKTALPNYTRYSFVSYRTSEGYVTFEMADADAVDKASVGGTECVLAMTGLLDEYLKGIGTVNVDYKPFDGKNNTLLPISSSKFNTFLKSADYDSAVKIIKSIK